jgi:hypothetical protein
MPALPAELKAKIAPLLRMQASDNDGERANASAAITRLLQRHGVDWHDLVQLLLAEPKPAAPEPAPPPNPGGTTSWKRSAGAIDLPRGQLLALLAIVEEKSPFLPIKSAWFISSLRSRSFRPTVHLSEKQWAWLQDLIEATGV